MSKRVLYLDPFSGISGDMFVGALLDLGLDLAILQSELGKLKLKGYTLGCAKVMRRGIAGTKFDVHIEGHGSGTHSHADHDHTHDHEHTHAEAGKSQELRAKSQEPGAKSHSHTSFAEIRALIQASTLSASIKERSIRAFTFLAEAEGRIHGKPAEQVAFHEAGAVDSIVDMVSVCIGLEKLGIEELRCGPVALGGAGGGYVQCAHGTLPVPAFATLELMHGIPIRPCEVREELTTPTGVALLRALVNPGHFGPLPPLQFEKAGYGAGTRDDPAIPIPNLLRAVLGTLASSQAEAQQVGDGPEERDRVVEIQANLDDATPEVLGYVSERLLALGALDIFFTPIQMKKSRPGTLITVLAEPAAFETLVEALFQETTTFGLRYETKSRAKLARETRSVKTPWGSVRVKVGTWKGRFMSAHPEYEDCKILAEKNQIPLRQILDAARAACTKEPKAS